MLDEVFIWEDAGALLRAATFSCSLLLMLVYSFEVIGLPSELSS